MGEVGAFLRIERVNNPERDPQRAQGRTTASS